MTPIERAREAVAKAIHAARQSRGFSGAALWEYEPADIHALYLHSADAALAAVAASLSAQGLVIVPKEASEGMMLASRATRPSTDWRDNIQRAWADMIAAYQEKGK